MTSLTQRNPVKSPEPVGSPPEPAPKKAGCPVNLNKGWRGWVRKAAVILIPAYTLCVMYGVLEAPTPLVLHAWDDFLLAMNSGTRVYTAEELRTLNAGKRPMLSILGEVFDVSNGEKFYGKHGAYKGFTGRDASRAFVTGDFSEEGLVDDVSGLEPSQCLGLKDWLGFYHVQAAKYKRRGVLQGRFYDEKGQATPALRSFERCVREGRQQKDREEAEKKLYPNCNSMWSTAEGGRVWCEDPRKVPRKIPAKPVHGTGVRSAGSRGSGVNPHGGEVEGEGECKDAVKAKGRCACFEPEYAKVNEKELLSYGGCAPESNSCDTKPPQSPKTK